MRAHVRRPGLIRLAMGHALVLAALCCAAAAKAGPPLGAPVDVAPADQQAAAGPSAAYDGGALLEVGWATASGENTLLATARRPLGGAFTPGPALASAEDLDAPEFATAPDGQIIAVWAVADATSGLGRIFVSALGANGEAIGAVPVSATGDDASEATIAVGPDGRVAIAWTVADEDTANGTVQAVHGSLGPSLSRRIVSGGVADAAAPAVAFDSSGVLQVAFTQLGSDDRIKVAAETVLGTFAPSRFVSPTGVSATEAAVAPGPGGGLAIAWTEDAGASEIVKVGVEPTPAAPFPTIGVPGGDSSGSVRLAVDPLSGALTVAWIRSPTSAIAGSALVATRTAGGAIDTPQVVSDADNVTDIDLAFSAAGDAALTWRRDLGTPTDPASDIRAALFDAPRASPPPPGPGGEPAPPPAALPPLTLTSFAVDPACIRYGAPIEGRRKRLSFGFVLSDAASVRLTIQRRLNSGTRRRCSSRRGPGQAGRLGPPVVIDLTSGMGPGGVSIRAEGEGVDEHAARGRRKPSRRGELGRRNRLTLTLPLKSGRRRIVLRQSPTTFAPGTYVATARAATAGGRQSAILQVKFWVLRHAKGR